MQSSALTRNMLVRKLGLGEVSTKVNRPISEFNLDLLQKLRTNVETLLNRLVMANGQQFKYRYSELQETANLSFVITGFIPTHQMRIISKKFKGAHIAQSQGAAINNSQQLLIPKALCVDVAQLPESYEDIDVNGDFNTVDSDDSDAEDRDAGVIILSKSQRRKIYIEMGVLATVMFLIVVYFLWLLYFIIIKLFSAKQ
jgi:hypothetical protein